MPESSNIHTTKGQPPGCPSKGGQNIGAIRHLLRTKSEIFGGRNDLTALLSRKPLFGFDQLFYFCFTEVACLSDDFHVYSHFQKIYGHLFSALCFAINFALGFAFNPSLIRNMFSDCGFFYKVHIVLLLKNAKTTKKWIGYV